MSRVSCQLFNNLSDYWELSDADKDCCVREHYRYWRVNLVVQEGIGTASPRAVRGTRNYPHGMSDRHGAFGFKVDCFSMVLTYPKPYQYLYGLRKNGTFRTYRVRATTHTAKLCSRH